jgi:hypothetical protein
MTASARRPVIAVIGAGQARPEDERAAEQVGRLLAERGAVLLCGGRGGVMDAACRGAAQGAGISIGLLPGDDRVKPAASPPASRRCRTFGSPRGSRKDIGTMQGGHSWVASAVSLCGMLLTWHSNTAETNTGYT